MGDGIGLTVVSICIRLGRLLQSLYRKYAYFVSILSVYLPPAPICGAATKPSRLYMPGMRVGVHVIVPATHPSLSLQKRSAKIWQRHDEDGLLPLDIALLFPTDLHEHFLMNNYATTDTQSSGRRSTYPQRASHKEKRPASEHREVYLVDRLCPTSPCPCHNKSHQVRVSCNQPKRRGNSFPHRSKDPRRPHADLLKPQATSYAPAGFSFRWKNIPFLRSVPQTRTLTGGDNLIHGSRVLQPIQRKGTTILSVLSTHPAHCIDNQARPQIG